MEQLYVAFWSGTGNTETMAGMVVKGAEEAGCTAKAVSIEDIKPEELAAGAVFAMGCPSMGNEELEDTLMEPFVAEIEGKVSGKTIGLFGSYGWGDGEWMQDWVARMEKAGATVVGGAGVICNDAPDDEAEQACKELGRKLAELLKG